MNQEINSNINEYERRKQFVNNIKFVTRKFSLNKLYTCEKCNREHQITQNDMYCYHCSLDLIEKNFSSSEKNFLYSSMHGNKRHSYCDHCTNESILFSMVFFPTYDSDPLRYGKSKQLFEKNKFLEIYRLQCVKNAKTFPWNKLLVIKCESCSKEISKLQNSKTDKCITCIVLNGEEFPKTNQNDCYTIRQALESSEIEFRKNLLDKFKVTNYYEEDKINEMIDNFYMTKNKFN